MTVSIRNVSSTDASRVAAVLLESRSAFLPYARSPHTDEEVRAWVGTVLLAREKVTVASDGDAVIGVMAELRDDGISWITQLYLSPSHVGRGIGSRLLAHALATAPRPIRLFTFQANAGARRFYERNGFRPIRFSDGRDNEERCPDVLYELSP